MKFQNEMNQDQRHRNHKFTKKSQRSQIRIQKPREQEVSDVVKNPRKIEFEIESPSPKLEIRKYLPTNERRLHVYKRSRIWRQSSKGWDVRVSKEDKYHVEIPRRKNLTLSSDRRGLQTVKDEFLWNLIRTTHEIHYRWNQWRMNGNKLWWKCTSSSPCEMSTQKQQQEKQL